MFKKIAIGLFLAAFCLCARAADTNSLVWHRATDRVDADVRGMALWPLLEKIAVEAGWHIYVEPDTTHTTSAKFKDLPSGDALKMLLGDLNFALVPRTNGVPQLYVFRTGAEKRHAAGARAEGGAQARSQRIARETQARHGH